MGFVSVEMLWSLSWSAVGLSILVCAARALYWAWLTPRRLERSLRAQGLKGTPYRFVFGDLKENTRLNEEARAKPMPPSHHIVPRVAPLLHRAMNQYGKTSFTWVGPEPRVTIMDPELLRDVLSRKFGHFEKTKPTPLGRLLATGLANYEGEKWATHRRILSSAFRVEKIKQLLPVFSACCDDLVGRWENLVGAEGCYELDVWPELRKFSRDVLSRSAFGSNYEEGKRIFQLQAEQAKLVSQANQTVYIPGYKFLPTSNNKRRRAIAKEVQELLRGMINKREEAIRKGEANNADDLLDLMIESNIKHVQELGKNAGMTAEDVIEECKLFYFAGQETTSCLLTWTMVALSMHMNWQVRAREEVLRVFGKNPPDYDGLSQLKTMTMILYEVLRLYPPATILLRRTYKTMMVGNITYPPGVLLAMPVVFIHHDPDYWGKDAGEFQPERFAQGISSASKDHIVAFFPFGGGPRICIAQNFALLEAKVGLAMILQRFSFELSPSYAHAPFPVITLQPEHGVPLRLRKL